MSSWSACPLTPLENRLRMPAGGTVYEGSFVERYLVPLIYPEELTRSLQIRIGSFVVVVNGAIYAWILRRSTSRE